MKKGFIFICILLIFLFSLASCNKTISSDEFFKLTYENKVDTFFPSISTFPESCAFKFYEMSHGGLFPTDKLYMVVSFDSVELYEKNKEYLNGNKFLDVDIIEKEKGVQYHILENGNNYPKDFCFVGYNDSNLEISYFWYSSQDQDYIGNFNDFVEKEYK